MNQAASSKAVPPAIARAYSNRQLGSARRSSGHVVPQAHRLEHCWQRKTGGDDSDH